MHAIAIAQSGFILTVYAEIIVNTCTVPENVLPKFLNQYKI